MSLQSRTGHTNMSAVVGFLVFQQFWYWFPLTHFLALAFTPTAIIGLNKDLKMPKCQFRSNAKPSTYAYPPPLEEKKDKKGEKVETAVLSITAKQKKKEADKKKEEGGEKMEVDEEKTDEAEKKEDKKEVKKEKEEKKEEAEEKEKEEKKKEEPAFEMLDNPARVMRAQLRVVSLPEGSKYKGLKDVSNGGIIMLSNSKPGEDEELIEHVAAGGPKVEEESEPEPPEPFEWPEDI
ncbi:26S proteasome non-ATPase regulatory subunit 1-like [Lingula anatina]|nr:26S proteasome non-ATPase regulatory subunit 1-like [Lingula anatina]|eukprot:XP_023930925.1 26S proteasome non-ATPase regulatory subunit 1-like [Lingula anatina]